MNGCEVTQMNLCIKFIETTSLILQRLFVFLKSQVSITLLKNVVKLVASQHLRTDSSMPAVNLVSAAAH